MSDPSKKKKDKAYVVKYRNRNMNPYVQNAPQSFQTLQLQELQKPIQNMRSELALSHNMTQQISKVFQRANQNNIAQQVRLQMQSPVRLPLVKL